MPNNVPYALLIAYIGVLLSQGMFFLDKKQYGDSRKDSNAKWRQEREAKLRQEQEAKWR